jgi:phage tail protein X
MSKAMKSGEYFDHETQLGERWDIIAWRYYNDPDLTGIIQRANADLFTDGLPKYPPILPPGIILKIPVLNVQPINDNLLPPWKRGQQ